MSSHDMKNPNGGVNMRHVTEQPDPNDHPLGEHPLPSYGPVGSVKRPVRTRMRGVVGAGGEKPPATRLDSYIFYPFNYVCMIFER